MKSDVDFILTNASRLMNVASVTAISFALWHGVNRALLECTDETDVREIAAGYRGDCAFTAVTRLVLLLDRDPKQVSFQTLYSRLQSEAVVTALLERVDDEFSTPSTFSDAVERFLLAYRSIDWQDLHGRLVHFRNRGIAHLTPHKIERRVTYAEIESLSRSVTIMGECMEPFAKDGIPLREEEIREWSDRAFGIWKVVLSSEAV
jgi:hypothetical protein